ncbi:methylcrotonoyl-CoA carboxylase beta chain, mitochondrial-like isoform X1 [Astyanax mexicanus]|uniref:methylcrotonoyl-CoA carboxylase n=1 Tax=Astyanax mexicanus TaxID=7994 RepID=A0A8T2LLQ9_ASTMX|nr:methylcrotonoyl-CoA carboxylase beta chain, mitochondrial-like isoform X1 [Astyanax mexicanus]
MYRCLSSVFCLNGGRSISNTPRHQQLLWAIGKMHTPAAFNSFLCWCMYSTKTSPLLHWTLNTQQPSWALQSVLHRYTSSWTSRKNVPSAFPVIDGVFHPIHRHVFETNLRNSQICQQRYQEQRDKVLKGGGQNAITRHTQRNKKILARDRIRMLLDDEDYLELSPFAGMGLSYGDILSAGVITGIGKINGIWCVFAANDATVKGGTGYPISVKKQLRAQEVAMQNRLPCVYLVDSGGAFLPLQADIFPDKNHGGRTFYNEAIMSAMKIPQVSLVCGSCTAGGAYTPSMAEEAVIVDRIGTIFLGGPPLVKAATGEEVTPEELGGATLHSKVSGVVDHFAAEEKEAFECVRNIISTLNFRLPEENTTEVEEPLYRTEDLMGLAPLNYSYSLDVRLIVSRLVDGSRFQEFKARYGTPLLTGFARIEGHLVGIVANNGELTYEASLKGSHFVQLCDQRDIPLIFLQNTAPEPAHTFSKNKAESNSNRLKAQGSMMSAVACASVPKITVVIGGCHGGDSFAMCGRAFDPNFLFLWPNARVSIVAPGHAGAVVQEEHDAQQINELLEEESSAFFSSGRLWDDGVILPQDTRKILGKCLSIIHQQEYQLQRKKQPTPLLRI